MEDVPFHVDYLLIKADVCVQSNIMLDPGCFQQQVGVGNFAQGGRHWIMWMETRTFGLGLASCYAIMLMISMIRERCLPFLFTHYQYRICFSLV